MEQIQQGIDCIKSVRNPVLCENSGFHHLPLCPVSIEAVYAAPTVPCPQVYKVMSTDPPRTLRWLSTGSGLLLILGGVAGVFTINPLAMIISIYNILFGVLIVLTELKSS